MGLFMVGTWLYDLLSMAPLCLWAIYILTKEGWMSSKGPVEKRLRVILWLGFAYQMILPFYWSYVLSSQSGLPFDFGNIDFANYHTDGSRAGL